jgi:hypothetical protein
VDTLLGIGQAFELDRGMIAQAGVDALFVVEALNVAGHGGVEFDVAHVASVVCEFSLERVEEALHVGQARSTHRLPRDV